MRLFQRSSLIFLWQTSQCDHFFRDLEQKNTICFFTTPGDGNF